MSNYKRLIHELQKLIQDSSEPETKAWFESYLKNSISYRGAKTPKILEIVKQWYKNHAVYDLSFDDQLEIAASLLLQKYAEDKFAGIFLFQKYLIQNLEWIPLIKKIEGLYKQNAFVDWSTNDWFNVRVLGPLISIHSTKAVKHFASWNHSPSLWQRRSSIVALRVCVNLPEYHSAIEDTIDNLLPSEERFIQTGIGWVISDLSKKHPNKAAKLIEKHFQQLSTEVIRRHTKYLRKHNSYISRKQEESKSKKKSK